MPETETCNEKPIRKVVVSDEALPFIARGGYLFPGQVIASDPGIENGDEVLVVDRRNNPLSTVQVALCSRSF